MTDHRLSCFARPLLVVTLLLAPSLLLATIVPRALVGKLSHFGLPAHVGVPLVLLGNHVVRVRKDLEVGISDLH